jgi:hypothetical protein
MRFKQGATLAGALFIVAAMTTGASAQPVGEWVDLGCRNVSFRTDRDTIVVGRREGRFRAIRLIARGADVEMLDLRVVYANGAPDDIPVRAVIRQGTSTRPLDLRGWERSINRIEIVYRSLPSFRGRQATVCAEGLAGRVAGPPGPPPGPGPGAWVELGCKGVSLFGKDRDSVLVGRREGRFKAIRLYVRGADVEMLDLKVIYANGSPDDIPVRAVIRQGQRTRPLDLRGWERAIHRVDMVYRTIPNFKGLANVCVEGLQ